MAGFLKIGPMPGNPLTDRNDFALTPTENTAFLLSKYRIYLIYFRAALLR